MDRRRVALLSLIAAALGFGCAEPDREQAEQAMASGGDAEPREITPASSPFLDEARLAVDELGREVHALGLQYADAAGSRAEEWDVTQRSIMEVREQVEADLARAGAAGPEALEDARVDIVAGLQTLTERVDRAQLEAVEGGQEFVSASEAELMEIDGRIESLRLQAAQRGDAAGNEVALELEALRASADEIAAALASMSAATEDEIAETREEMAQSIASLSGSVQRQWLELRG